MQNVKQMAWRDYRNILPTRHNLQRRTIIVDSSGPRCSAGDKMDLHLYFEYFLAWDVW